jgi:zinc protease
MKITGEKARMLTQKWTLRAIVAAVTMAAAPLCVATTAGQVSAQEKPATVTAEQVIDGYVKAIGGAEKLQSFKTRRTTAKFSMPAVGLQGPMTVTQSAPNSYKLEVEIPGIGKILQICDGEKVLDKNPLTGERMLEGTEKDTVMLEANFYSDSQWRKVYVKTSYEGREDIEGRPCHKVALETTSGNKRTHFYDVETNYLVKVRTIVSTPQGELATENTLSDYKDVDGVKFPHKTIVSVMGQQQEIVIEKIENNPQLADDAFKI